MSRRTAGSMLSPERAKHIRAHWERESAFCDASQQVWRQDLNKAEKAYLAELDRLYERAWNSLTKRPEPGKHAGKEQDVSRA